MLKKRNDNHGKNFVKIMNEINVKAGTNISIYHDFHNEVALYRKLLYRCNGICQMQPPNYGLFIPHSFDDSDWLVDHLVNCGGLLSRVSHTKRRTFNDTSNTELNGVAVVDKNEDEMFVDECHEIDTKVQEQNNSKERHDGFSQLLQRIDDYDLNNAET